MTGGISYKPGSERGAWFELKCLRETITLKETAGKDASYERGLYKSWLKVPEYSVADKENIGKGFYGVLPHVRNGQGAVSKIPTKGNIPSLNYETPNYAILSPATSLEVTRRGRPRKSGKVSRVTAWRRAKERELQGVLI
ncbi:hypothetical protein ACFLTY_05435 [Chloroflexota bacterium]